MTPEQFTYWLQGFVEVGKTPPTPEQWQEIKNHLATVFHKVTPDISNPNMFKYDPNNTWPNLGIAIC
jgi:hypothetical protein